MEQEDFNIREHQLTSKERDFENALRPLSFEDFSGQDKVVENLRIFVKAARLRGEALDHVLLHGPPGLGKTTLSNIIANELGVGFKVTSGPVLDKPGDLAGVLTSLEPNDVLFIDEIHRLSPVVEEYLYSAMEDYRIDIMIDKGPSARSIQIDLNPFTLVGATTRSGLLTAPLRARFGINLHLEYYDDDILSNIIRRSASILDVPCSVRAASEIASRSRGTPRIANALLRRVRDFAQVKGQDRHFDRSWRQLQQKLRKPQEAQGREIAQQLFLLGAGSQMLRHASPPVAQAWCRMMLDTRGGTLMSEQVQSDLLLRATGRVG